MFKNQKNRKIALLLIFLSIIIISGFYSYQSSRLAYLGYNAEKQKYETIASMIYGTLLYKYPYTFAATAVRCRIAFQQDTISSGTQEYKDAGLSTIFSPLQREFKLSGDKFDYFCILTLFSSILLTIFTGWATNWRVSFQKPCIIAAIFIVSYIILTLLAINGMLPRTYTFKTHAIISVLYSITAIIFLIYSFVVVFKAFFANEVKKCLKCGFIVVSKATICSKCNTKFDNNEESQKGKNYRYKNLNTVPGN